MEVQIRTVDDITVVEPSGEIDSNSAPELQEQMTPLLQPGAKLLMDMSRVEFMSSAGLRIMLLIYRQMADTGKIVLVGLTPGIQDSMSATGFLKFFTLADTLDEGVKVLNG
ncbi:MAG: anti-sigma factor antagonist [Chloroflexi bacterium]|nr:anti-sigma factor antagonist [Chloroflexota bacterium]